LLKVVERDLAELRTAYENRQHKTTMLPCGSILEAVLIDALQIRVEPRERVPIEGQAEIPRRVDGKLDAILIAYESGRNVLHAVIF
jgi:hypothetical protein